MKPFGGGGHISAAGLKYQTDNVEELKKQILAEETLVAVEDLYRPYRPKAPHTCDNREGESRWLHWITL